MSEPTFLFLDIDGVLNNDRWLSRKTYHAEPWPMRDVDPMCCGRLARVLRDFDVKIVLSSSWRAYANVSQWLEFCGLRVYGRTPNMPGRSRGEEIAAFLKITPKPLPFLILDDEADMLPEHLPFLIRTDPKQGLTVKKAEELRARLREMSHD